ncbi:MAG TPA: glycosyltransferase family 4 protein [Candidatus Sulfotelmatobacter sp.]|nr:glycosyltransferase family 4 protein [Candidatus Sulfotelmatobacter sp.]
MSRRRQVGGRRVWIVNHYAEGPDRPGGPRHYQFAQQLQGHGRVVTVFAAGLNHQTGTSDRVARGRLFATTDLDGVRFVWLRTFPYRGNTWRRQVNMLSFLLVFLVVQARFERPDVILGSSVHPFAALGAWLAATIRRARFVFEIRDLWPQTLVDLGDLRMGSPGERTLRWIEAWLVRHADAVVTLLPGMRDYLSGQGLPAAHVVYVPNGVDLAAFDRAEIPPAVPATRVAQVAASVAAMRSEGRLVFGYLGAIGRVNRVDVIVAALREAERRAPGRIGLLIVGDGPERAALQAGVSQRDPIAFHASVEHELIPHLLRGLDAGIVHTTRTPVYRYGISFNKLYEYMAARLPVLFACETAFDPVAENRAGITIPPDDPVALGRAMLELASAEPGDRAAMGARGRAFVEQAHDAASLARALASVL